MDNVEAAIKKEKDAASKPEDKEPADDGKKDDKEPADEGESENLVLADETNPDDKKGNEDDKNQLEKDFDKPVDPESLGWAEL